MVRRGRLVMMGRGRVNMIICPSRSGYSLIMAAGSGLYPAEAWIYVTLVGYREVCRVPLNQGLEAPTVTD